MRSLLWCLLAIGCSSPAEGEPDGMPGPDGQPEEPAACTEAEQAELAGIEAEMAASLEAAATNTAITKDPVFTVLIETKAGRRFAYSHGASTATTRYESASTSKWVTAAVLMDLVDRGALSLDTTAHSLLPFWTEPAVDLRDLLSFTSGFDDEPGCINLPGASFEACVEKIYADNEAKAAPPGTHFHYSGTHMQVAGLMAIRAASASSWTELFDAFRARTGLFPTSAYDLPSTANPRLGGGMTWTAEEYLGFLRALHLGTVLSAEARAQLHANQRGAATVEASPVYAAISEDWAYGLGNWLECPTATAPDSFDCGAGHRNSSAGAYGAYPYIDFDHGYHGIVARQGGLGSGDEGIALFRTIEARAAAWASKPCR